MFDDEFFPTPGFVIRKMLEPYLERMGFSRSDTKNKRYIHTVLDPEAGSGAILKWLRTNQGKHYCPRLLAIEKSPQLAAIVQAEGFELIDNDFLTYTPEHRIDLIAMNPPFSNGDEHLLHAWNVLVDGDIVCLLNAETIRNPHTRRRETLAKLIEDHGTVEFLGPVFERAERPTSCEIAMVRLTKIQPESEKLNFDFVPANDVQEAGFAQAQIETGTDLAKPDLMGAIVRQYEMTKEGFGDLLRARNKMAFFSRSCTKSSWDAATKALERGHGGDAAAYEAFTAEIRTGFWEHCFRTLGMEKYLTKGLMEKVRLYVEQQGKMAFTKENIAKMLETMMLNRHAIMQQAVEAVFDEFTRYHEDNRIHPEGWKSNKSWKVTRKVVLPYYIDASWSSGLRISSSRYRETDDIDRVMCYLSGTALEDIVTISRAVDAIPKGETLGMSTFFKIRGYKKGTIHLEFLDEALWNRFNIEACKGKGWIGQQKEKA